MKLDLQNFQAHSNTSLDIDGITVITGESNSGKSSIIRGILWLLTNKPTGTSFIKRGAKEAKVSFLETDRIRSSKHNRYSFKGSDYDAIKTEVPTAIAKSINMSAASMQRQRDIDFLIGLSPTQAGALLDETLHLTDIATIEITSASELREATKAATALKQEKDNVLKELQLLEWTDSANEILEKINTLTDNITGWKATILKGKELLNRYKELNNRIIDLSWTEKTKKVLAAYQEQKENDSKDMIDLDNALKLKRTLNSLSLHNTEWFIPCRDLTVELDKVNAELASVAAKQEQAQRLKAIYNSIKTKDLFWISTIKETVDKLANLYDVYDSNRNKASNALKTKLALKHYNSILESNRNKIAELKAQLPKVCSECGRIF